MCGELSLEGKGIMMMAQDVRALGEQKQRGRSGAGLEGNNIGFVFALEGARGRRISRNEVA